MQLPKVNVPRLVDSFVSAARIWGASGHEKPMADKMVAEFQALDVPGLTVEVDDSAPRTGSDTGNVIVDVPATAPGARSISLSFHLDRVPVRAPGVPEDEPVQIEITDDGVIRSKGSRTNIAADDRTGYACVKEALQLMKGYPHGHLRIIGFTREESGIHGARNLDPKYLQGLDYGFEMDGGKVGNIILGGGGIHRFTTTIRGKSAPSIHARDGISALEAGLELGKQLQTIEPKGGQLMLMTNFQSGKQGEDGSPITNAVPDTAVVSGEFRGRTPADEAEMQQKFDEALRKAGEKGAQLQTAYNRMQGFLLAEDAPVVQFAERATLAAGSKPKRITMMGGSDANYLNAKGLPTVVLGSGCSLQHTERESTSKNDLTRATQVVMAVIAATAS